MSGSRTSSHRAEAGRDGRRSSRTTRRRTNRGSGFATMPDCQSSRTIRAAGVIAVLLPSWNEVRNLSAGSYHSRISTTLGSDAGTIAIPSSPRVNSDGDLWCSPRRRFGSTKASRHCGVADYFGLLLPWARKGGWTATPRDVHESPPDPSRQLGAPHPPTDKSSSPMTSPVGQESVTLATVPVWGAARSSSTPRWRCSALRAASSA